MTKSYNEKMETAAASRPYGLWLSAAGIEAYASIFYPNEMAGAVIERLKKTPPYRDGSPRPQLWFQKKKDALSVRDVLNIRARGIHAFPATR